MELQITYRHIPTSDFLSARIRELAEALEKQATDLRSCRMVIDEPHQKHGKPFHAKLIVEVEGAELVAEHTDDNAYVAVQDAFKAIERQIQSHEQKRRKEVKRHSLR